MTAKINWHVPLRDMDTIKLITHRAVKLGEKLGFTIDFINLEMDITATHANGCPLDLEKLLAAGDVTFCHDIGGIRSNLNRKTGKLERCFVPRCARAEPKPPRMIPGQKPYTVKEYGRLKVFINEACDGDPGEAAE